METKFLPKVGMKSSSCYIPRLTQIELNDVSGTIINVGVNYFILEPNNRRFDKILIKSDKYPLVEKVFNKICK